MADKLLEIHPIVESEQQPRFWLTRRKIKYLAFGLGALLLAVYVGIHLWFWHLLNHVIVREHSRDYKKIQAFYSSMVRFPAEWKTAPGYSPVFSQEIGAIQKIWNELKKKNDLLQYVSLEEDLRNERDSLRGGVSNDWKKINPLLDQCEAILGMTSELARRFGDEMLKYPSSEAASNFGGDDWFMKQVVQLSRLHAFSLAHEGKFTQAVDAQLALAPFFIQNPIADYNGYQNSKYELSDFLTEIRSLIVNVGDQERLKSYLDILNRWAPYFFCLKEEFLPLYSLYDELKMSQTPIDYDKDRKGSEYLQRLVDRRYPPMEFDKVFTTLFENWLAGTPREPYASQPLEIELARPFLLTNHIEEFYWLRTRFDDSFSLYEREQRFAKQYDELRLFIAARLYFLENKKYPVEVGELTPAYFPPAVCDKIMEQKFRWNPNTLKFEAEP